MKLTKEQIKAIEDKLGLKHSPNISKYSFTDGKGNYLKIFLDKPYTNEPFITGDVNKKNGWSYSGGIPIKWFKILAEILECK